MITRRQFLIAVAPAALILPVLADELLHPGRKFFLPPTKIFLGPVVVPVEKKADGFLKTMVEHSYLGRDGRMHRSQFYVHAADVDQLVQAVKSSERDYLFRVSQVVGRERIRQL